MLERDRRALTSEGVERRSLLVAMLTVGVAACASAGTTSAGGEPTPFNPAEYRAGPGDQLNIVVFGQPDLSGLMTIGADGRIAYPLLGDVRVEGRTPGEIANAIADGLRQGYVREPAVSVSIAAYRPFFILGEVANAGSYPYTPNLTVVSAVATAGGFTYRANTRRVFIQHSGRTAETEYVLTRTIPVRPGDIIRIPERFF
jgi:polysaccharide export outer membrane protein